MTESWGSILTDLVPLALIITFSPLSIIPAVMVLQTPKPRPTALMYLLGWVLALVVLTAVFVALSGLVTPSDGPPRWASVGRIVLGAALIIFGVYRWLTRHKRAHSPAWMRQLTSASPMKAGVTGVVLAVANPKVFLICLAAGVAIGTANLGAHGESIAVIYFVAIAAASVALPVLAYVLSGDKLDRQLEQLKDWTEKHNAALVAGILVVIGVMVLYKGISGLA